jgi:hypothetical protein
MADPRTLTLAGRTFTVPPLPLKATMVVYPICRRLTIAGLVREHRYDGLPGHDGVAAGTVRRLLRAAPPDGRLEPGGGGGRPGGREGDGPVPDIDFNRIIAKLVRHFHQPAEYWLTQSTLQDWFEIYDRELREAPPPEAFLASYFSYEPPHDGPPVPVEEVAVPSLSEL